MTLSLGAMLLSWYLTHPVPDLQQLLTPVRAAAAAQAVCIRGAAGWYGQTFHGKRTASGEAFDMNAFTAAHRTLPFGTRVRVRHLRTGRSVVVRINDRGPFTRGRDLDLSFAAARELGFVNQGWCKIELVVLGR